MFMGVMGFGKPKILHSCWQHHKGLRCWVHFCTLHWVDMLPTNKFHFPRAFCSFSWSSSLWVNDFLGVYLPSYYHLWVHLYYSPCVLIFITWVFAHLNVPHFMFQFASFKLGLILVPCFVFQSLSFELEFILMFPTLCLKPCYLNFCPSWFIPLCLNPHHLSLSSSLSRCTIKCFTIVMKRCFFS
jgi:hypothetical protein